MYSNLEREENERHIRSLSRYIFWGHRDRTKCVNFYYDECVFSVDRLPTFLNTNHFIAKIFFLEYDPIAYQCMEEWYFHRENRKPLINMVFYCYWIKRHSTLADCHWAFLQYFRSIFFNIIEKY